MTLEISAIEVVWFALNTATLFYSLTALGDARANQKAVKLLNGHARELVSRGIVRRCWFRVFFMVGLLAITVPTLFRPGNEQFTIGLVAIMILPVLLFLDVFFESQDRKKLIIVTTADVLRERTDSFARLEAAHAQLLADLAENTAISKQASEHADAAYHEANNINQKIATQGAAIVAMDSNRERIEETIDDTHDKVVDIHEATDLA